DGQRAARTPRADIVRCAEDADLCLLGSGIELDGLAPGVDVVELAGGNIGPGVGESVHGDGTARGDTRCLQRLRGIAAAATVKSPGAHGAVVGDPHVVVVRPELAGPRERQTDHNLADTDPGRRRQLERYRLAPFGGSGRDRHRHTPTPSLIDRERAHRRAHSYAAGWRGHPADRLR